MNPSEAIENIEYARRWLGSESDFSEDALDLAISALEFKERYDQFWENVKAAGKNGKETMKLTLDVAIEALKNEIICIENKHCVEGQYCDACQYEIDDEDFVNVLNFIIPILEKQTVDKCCETCKYKNRSGNTYPCFGCFRASDQDDYYEPYTEEE